MVSSWISKSRVGDLATQIASSDFVFAETVVRCAVQAGDLFQIVGPIGKFETGYLSKRVDFRGTTPVQNLSAV